MCIVLNCRMGGRYFCRCYDRGQSMSERIVISPRHQEFRFSNGTIMSEHYWMFGTAMMSLDRPLYYEACNEHGLCMAALTFEGYAEYADEAEEGKLGVLSFAIIPWVLGQCKTLQEAKDLLSKTTVLAGRFSNKIPSPPLHWMISDTTGSAVAEPLPEGLRILDNPAEVMTHGPPIRYHLDNIRNYAHLTNRTPRNLLPEQIRTEKLGRGTGAVGLPGDYSSASRFIRGCFVKYNTVPEEYTEDNIEGIFRMMETLSIPKGCMELSQGVYEYTRHTVCLDADRCRLYYRCYCNSQICRVDATKTDIDGTDPIVFNLLDSPQFLYQN